MSNIVPMLRYVWLTTKHKAFVFRAGLRTKAPLSSSLFGRTKLDFGSALERAAMLRSKAAAMERALAASPDDKGLRITLLSARRMADRAEEELAEAAKQSDIDLCRYRVKRTEDGHYAAEPPRELRSRSGSKESAPTYWPASRASR